MAFRPAAVFGVSLAASLAGAGCATLPPPRGPLPLYDFDTVWFNEPVGGVAPWKKEDRKGATAAAIRREEAWARSAAPAVARASKKAAKPAPEAPAAAVAKAGSAAAKKGGKSPPKKAAKAPPKKEAKQSAGKVRPPALPARIAAADVEPRGSAPAPAPAAEVEGTAVRAGPGRPVLGDGSVAGELVAAAVRVLGIRDGFEERGFLAHLLTVAAVDLDVKAPKGRYVEAVWEALESRGATFSGSDAAPGDLAFFHGVEDLDGSGRADDRWSAVAVVERVEASGVLVCIGEVRGEVVRFRMDPSRPRVRRDEVSGEVVNSPLRRRSLEDGPEAATNAGELLAGFARP